MKQLPPLPPIAARLMALVSSDATGFRSVAELIRLDSAFSGEVLRLANSPLLGSRHEVSSILQAVALLGLDRVKSLVMTVVLRDLIAKAPDLPLRLLLWRHSLATALLCELVAPGLWIDKDRAYTTGLLHDVGRAVLLAGCGAPYAHALERAEPSPDHLLGLEQAEFHTDHCTAGRRLMSNWGLPLVFHEAAAHHHDPPVPGEEGVITVIQVCCRLASLLGFRVIPPLEEAKFDQVAEALPAGSRNRLSPEPDLSIWLASRINAVECSLL